MAFSIVRIRFMAPAEDMEGELVSQQPIVGGQRRPIMHDSKRHSSSLGALAYPGRSAELWATLVDRPRAATGLPVGKDPTACAKRPRGLTPDQRTV